MVPVPDGSRPAAIQISAELGLPYREGLVKNRWVALLAALCRHASRCMHTLSRLGRYATQTGSALILLAPCPLCGPHSCQHLKPEGSNSKSRVLENQSCATLALHRRTACCRQAVTGMCPCTVQTAKVSLHHNSSPSSKQGCYTSTASLKHLAFFQFLARLASGSIVIRLNSSSVSSK